MEKIIPPKIVNISKVNNCFVYLPAKTASSLFSQIFDNYDFETYEVDREMRFINKGFSHSHDYPFFNNHERYQFICTTRNPYARLLSFYGDMPYFNRSDFEKSLELHLFANHLHTEIIEIFNKRKPDIIIKFESLYEDLMKIPFIRNSSYIKSEKFTQLFNSKPHYRGFDYDWKDYYDKDLADLVYYNSLPLFDVFGYEKDSWKK